VDIPFALACAAFAIPGSIMGRAVVGAFDRRPFAVAVGVLLASLAVYLVLRASGPGRPQDGQGWGRWLRVYALPSGSEVRTVVDMRIAGAASLLIGLAAALFGIGGGVLFVPLAVGALGIPAHAAAATSQFFLLFTTAASVGTDLLATRSGFTDSWLLAMPLAVGALVGGQIGPRIARRISAAWIVRLLAGALGVVGLRLIASVF
jgi:hypothetical protein